MELHKLNKLTFCLYKIIHSFLLSTVGSLAPSLSVHCLAFIGGRIHIITSAAYANNHRKLTTHHFYSQFGFSIYFTCWIIFRVMAVIPGRLDQDKRHILLPLPRNIDCHFTCKRNSIRARFFLFAPNIIGDKVNGQHFVQWLITHNNQNSKRQQIKKGHRTSYESRTHTHTHPVCMNNNHNVHTLVLTMFYIFYRITEILDDIISTAYILITIVR